MELDAWIVPGLRRKRTASRPALIVTVAVAGLPASAMLFERVETHPRVGADILRDVPFGAPVAELVLCYHDCWDGLGYPAGLRGDEIPLGAAGRAAQDRLERA